MAIVPPDGPSSLPAIELAARLAKGTLQATVLAESCLDRVSVREPVVRAWAHLDPALIRATAITRDTTAARSRLHGVPLGVKDVILTRDMPTRYNSPLDRACADGADAACVSALRQAGAVIFGKTDTVEFASVGRLALTRNPHDDSRTPGASSSGSAAAVTDYHVPLALGTQTAGSIIRPASFCGVYGFKPSWGLVSTDGVKCFAPSLDTVGWFARAAEDLALVMDVFRPPGEGRPRAAHCRVALCRTPMWDSAGPQTRAAIDAAIRRFEHRGATVTELVLPPPFARLPAAQTMIMRAEGGRSMLPEYLVHGDRLHPALRAMVTELQQLDYSALLAAYDLAATCRASFDDLAAGFDALLAPSTVGEAPDRSLGTGDYLFNGMWTLLHAPCINLPRFVTGNGLPVGVTLTGARFSDRRLLDVAAQFWA